MTTDNQDSHITETSEELTDNTTFGIDESVIDTTTTDNEADTSILENNLVNTTHTTKDQRHADKHVDKQEKLRPC